ncbi:MAG: HU family DNA-binding protein [Mycoplasma sp.]
MSNKFKEKLTALAQEHQISKRELGEILDAYADLIVAELKKEDSVSVLGLGKFKIVHRKARKGVSPATGKAITIPACRKVKFVPTKSLKQDIK